MYEQQGKENETYVDLIPRPDGRNEIIHVGLKEDQ